MKIIFRISGVILLINLIHSCKKDKPPIVITTDLTEISFTTAILGGEVINEGGVSVVSRGVCWNNTFSDPTIADSKTIESGGLGSFTSNITQLTPNTMYYVRAYATNSVGTGYGIIMSFTTPIEIIFNPNLTYGTAADIYGNVYKTITIGTQTWMAENLKTTKYNDGTLIPNVTDNAEWKGLTTPAYCWYNNDAATYKATYGALYNWYTVNTGILCPTGWHVASDAEWHTLVLYLDASASPSAYESLTAGGKLKETGTTHWENINTGATNESGFTALPGGYRQSIDMTVGIGGKFFSIGGLGYWWSSTKTNTDYIWVRVMGRNDSGVNRYDEYDKKFGFSVRCLRDY